MKKIVTAVLVMWSLAASAGSQSYDLNSVFLDARKAEFIQSVGKGGETISGVLINSGGKRFSLPDTCEPEGGNAELKDAFTVAAKENYFLFVCAWPVQHQGLGISGTQYETFLYSGDHLGDPKNNASFSQALSGYEGSLEEGGNSYMWYLPRKIASKKITELELGSTTDSLDLAHEIILARLKDGDFEGVKAYMGSDRFEQLSKDFPITKANIAVYNDFGYALGQAGENALAYKILKSVELISPDRMVLKLNIADVLWGSDKKLQKFTIKNMLNLCGW